LCGDTNIDILLEKIIGNHLKNIYGIQLLVVGLNILATVLMLWEPLPRTLNLI
jgi:hypothetical protein